MQIRLHRLFGSLFAAGIAASAVLLPSTGRAAGDSAPAHQKWALLVGVGGNINPDNELLGPKNDVPAMRDLLRGGYGFTTDHLKVLSDTGATRAAILNAWEWLIKSAKPGDLVVFYYSGHGIDVPDTSKPTGRDSALCPYDARRRADLIPGSQIGGLIDRLKTDQVVVIVDACNSGSATRDLRMRKKSPDPASFGLTPMPPLASPSTAAAPFAGQTNAIAAHKERYIGAARIDQCAMDYPFLEKADSRTSALFNGTSAAATDNPNMGALTFFLLKELRADPTRQLTYDELVRRVRRDLSATFGGEAQEPQESGRAMDSTPFLSLTPVNGSGAMPAPGATRSAAEIRKNALPIAVPTTTKKTVKGETLTLRSLAGATLTPGSILQTTGGRRWNEIDDAPASDAGTGTAAPTPTAAAPTAAGAGVVQIVSVNGSTATAVVLSGAVPTGAPLAEALNSAPDDQLRVAIAIDGQAGDRLRAALGSIDHVLIVAATQPSDVTLYPSSAIPDGVDAYRGSIALPSTAADKIPALLANLQAVKQLADLENSTESASGAAPIHVRVQNDEGKEGYIESKVGGKTGFTITVDQTAYITLIDLAPDGSITGATLPKPLPANVPFALPPEAVNGPAGLDTIKVIATSFRPTIPLPANAAAAAAMGDDGKPAAIAHRVLDALRKQVNHNAGTKGLDFAALAAEREPTVSTTNTATSSLLPAPIATDGWAVTDLLLRIEPAE